MNQRPLDTAAAYADIGLRVLPLCGPTHRCKDPGKRPWDPVSQSHMIGWQRRGVPTAADVDSWIAGAGADRANLGCLTGHGLAWLDVDGPEGEAQLRAILGPNPVATWEFRRGSDSRRLIYAVPKDEPVPTIGGDAGHAGLRVLGDGAQSVVPPSRHQSADLYAWTPGQDPWAFGLAAPAPAPLLELLRSRATKGKASPAAIVSAPFAVPTGVDFADLTAVRELLPEHLRGVLDRGLAACPGRYPSRSEAVFALVGSIIASGVHDQVGAAVLASRPWLAARYGRNPLGDLMREFARARAKGSKAWHFPTDSRLMQPLDMSNPADGPSSSGLPAGACGNERHVAARFETAACREWSA